MGRMEAPVTANAAGLATSYDVVVMGSGAAGLTSAVRAAHGGASVLVLEKAALLGGTTSAGGGVIWAPNNHLSMSAGFEDSRAAGISYLRAAAGHAMPAEDIEWFVETAADVIGFLDRHTRVRLAPLARPDYHLEWDGAAAGGRSLDNLPFSDEDHPGLAAMLRPSTYFPLLTMIERDNLNGRAPDPQLLRSRADEGIRTMGGALAGSLAATAIDLGVRLAVQAPVTGLSRSGSGWNVEIAGRAETIRAGAVVVASGGFEFNADMRAAFLPLPVTPIGAPSNEGDGLELALAAGAAVRDMTAMWGVPVITPPGARYDGRPTGRMANVEMTLPGSITVNAAGRRFVNEALNYHDAARVFANTDPESTRQQNNPAWLVFDADFHAKYPVAGSVPGVAQDWMNESSSLQELAEKTGIDAAGLAETVLFFNSDARKGTDTLYGRGASEQDRHLGDQSNLPNPCLSPLDRPPFYAVPVHAGMLGTSGGLAVNQQGQVLGWDGGPITGLYAAGNAAAGIFRNHYPGGGATLGSAVTRAYAAARHLCGDTA
ncbi:FAD-dependent oxidoreductase [Arthrobacter caoxuetaonis]|nr:FAD-dependent oxidoreductase [Arthrobacter caoxuetaonis]MCC3281475.1 FAD-dependent oxidoreductase [Arthrobacter caoxuetaonis]